MPPLHNHNPAGTDSVDHILQSHGGGIVPFLAPCDEMAAMEKVAARRYGDHGGTQHPPPAPFRDIAQRVDSVVQIYPAKTYIVCPASAVTRTTYIHAHALANKAGETFPGGRSAKGAGRRRGGRGRIVMRPPQRASAAEETWHAGNSVLETFGFGVPTYLGT